MGLTSGIVLEPGVVSEAGIIVTEEPLGVTPSTTGVFPLGFSWEPYFESDFLGGFRAKILRIIDADTISRTIVSLGRLTWGHPCDGEILFLGDFIFPEIKSLGEGNGMLGHLDALESSVRLSLSTHGELSRSDVDHFHLHAIAEIKSDLFGSIVSRRRHGSAKSPVGILAITATEHARARTTGSGIAFPGSTAHDRRSFGEKSWQENLQATLKTLHRRDVPGVPLGLGVCRCRNQDRIIRIHGNLLVLISNLGGQDFFSHRRLVSLTQFFTERRQGLRFRLFNDLGPRAQRKGIPLPGLALVFSINPLLSQKISDPLGALYFQKRLRIHPRLGRRQEITIFVIAALGPATAPATAEIDNPSFRSPMCQSGMSATRTGRGGNSEST